MNQHRISIGISGGMMGRSAALAANTTSANRQGYLGFLSIYSLVTWPGPRRVSDRAAAHARKNQTDLNVDLRHFAAHPLNQNVAKVKNTSVHSTAFVMLAATTNIATAAASSTCFVSFSRQSSHARPHQQHDASEPASRATQLVETMICAAARRFLSVGLPHAYARP